MNPFFLLSALAMIAIIVLVMVWMLSRRRRRIPSGIKIELRRQWGSAIVQQDQHRKILDAENVLDRALYACGYRGSFGEKLKASGPRFSNLQGIWDAHKIRNRIAHESGFQVHDASSVIRAYEHALSELL